MGTKQKVVATAVISAALCATCFGCSATTESGSSASADSSAESSEVSIDGKYVTVDWLKAHLDDVAVVDVRSADTFANSHIPGATNLHWTSISNVEVDQGTPGWGELLDADSILAAAAAAGIDGTKPVVLYTSQQDGWGEDGRIYWSLGEAGLTDLHILDGGWGKWVGSDGDIVASNHAVDDADPIEQVDTAYVKAHMGSAVLVDARTAKEYDGKTTMGEARGGRIPGAVSVPYVSLFNTDGTLLSTDELKSIFEDAGVKTSDEAIVYCTGGVRAAAVAEIMADLGYNDVKVYTAGFSEWAGDAANTVEAETAVSAA